jgi:RNA polymerase sigma factor (sigma-70 family)
VGKAPDTGAFRSLIDALGGGRVGATAYEALRRRLVRFFERRGAVDAESLADVTLDRVGERKARGDVEVDNVTAFAMGVARLVALEHGRRVQRQAPVPEELPSPRAPSDAGEIERRLAGLEAALAELREDDRALVLAYYASGDGRGRIDGRAELAARLGVSQVNLRVRAFRARTRLEAVLGRGGS